MTREVVVGAAAEQVVIRKQPSRIVWLAAKAPLAKTPSLKMGGGILPIGDDWSSDVCSSDLIMTACSAAAPTMTSRVIESNLHVNSELAEQLDPLELFSLNELLDRIAALGVATDYDQIGPKPDPREINSPQVTHHIAVVEEQSGDSSSILKTSYVRIPDPSMPDS